MISILPRSVVPAKRFCARPPSSPSRYLWGARKKDKKWQRRSEKEFDFEGNDSKWTALPKLTINFTRAILFDYFRKGPRGGARPRCGVSRCRSFPWYEGGPSGGLCPHKWLPGSAVAHLPLIPTPRLTFASSFLCSSFLLPSSPHLVPVFLSSRVLLSLPQSLHPLPSFLSLSPSFPQFLPFSRSLYMRLPLSLCLSPRLTLSCPAPAHVCTTGYEGNGHAYLFLDIFGRPRDIHPALPRISNEVRRCFRTGTLGCAT